MKGLVVVIGLVIKGVVVVKMIFESGSMLARCSLSDYCLGW